MKLFIVLVFVSSIMAVFSAPSSTTDRPHRKPFDESEVFGDLENVFRGLEEEQKKLEETIRSQFQGLNNVLHVDPLFKTFDPSKVQNKTLHDTRIVDGKVFETDEQVYSSGTAENGRIIHTKTVIMKPADDRPVTNRSPSTDITPKTMFEKEEEHEDALSEEIRDDVELEMNNEVSDDENSMKPRSTEIDLSGDTRVNDRLSENQEASGYRISEPDAELIDINSINNSKVNADSHRYYYSL